MRRLWHQRLQLQLGFALLAAISVALLAVELTEHAVRHAERFVLSDASKPLTSAVGELQREYRMRVTGDNTWSASPACAQDVTLRARMRCSGGWGDLKRHTAGRSCWMR